MARSESDGFSAIELAQLKLLIVEVIQQEFANIGLRVDSEAEVFNARRDFATLRWIREATNRTAQKLGWAVIAAILAGGLTIGKLGVDAYIHR